MKRLQKLYENDAGVQSFLSNYECEDIAAVSLNVNSINSWNISPPNMQRLNRYLHGNKTLHFRFKFRVSRETGSIESSTTFDLSGNSLVRSDMMEVLNSQNFSHKVYLPHLFPKFVKVKI